MRRLARPLISFVVFMALAGLARAELAAPAKPRPTVCRWDVTGIWHVTREGGSVIVVTVNRTHLPSDTGSDYQFEGTAVHVASGETGHVSGGVKGDWVSFNLTWAPKFDQPNDYQASIGPDGHVMNVSRSEYSSGRMARVPNMFHPSWEDPDYPPDPKSTNLTNVFEDARTWQRTEPFSCVKVPLSTVEIESTYRPGLPLPTAPAISSHGVSELAGTNRLATAHMPSDAATTGTFDTSFGVLTLTNQGGNYSTSGGRVTVTRLDGNIMEGVWEQSSASRRCANGRYYGKFTFTFAADGFAGAYGYCDEPINAGPWNGKRR